MKRYLVGVLAGAIAAFNGLAQTQQVTLTIRADQTGPVISPLFYGMMTEELNHSYDGGLYADLIQNRIFQQIPYTPPARSRTGADPATESNKPPAATVAPAAPNLLIHWSLVNSQGATGAMAIDSTNPVNATALKHSLRLDIANVHAGQRVGVANDGYWGIPVKPNTEYKASFYVRTSPGFVGPLTVGIESMDGKTVYASGTISNVGAQWQKQALTLKTGPVGPTTDARFVVSAAGSGSVWLSLVSLMPPTYKGLPFRPDIMEKLVDLRPAFLRFPGGAYVAGQTVAERWAWKTTLGLPEQRTGHMNTAWDYWASDGIGMHEFLLWCEAMKAEPLLVLHTGYVFTRRQLGAGPELDGYVQEGLDAIEYVTGDVSTKWGAERAKNGHPAPFKLTYVQIGNEEERGGAETYPQRFTAFHDAIRARYPNLKIVSGMQHAGPNASMPRHPDVIDDHYYPSNITAALNAARSYDPVRYDRGNPKIFIGEYATRMPRDGNTPNMLAACGDAAFLIGMERNADVVIMTTYAPLLTNINPGAAKWPVNLIGYDALSSYVSPSYWVQKMFIANRGDVLLPTQIKNAPRLGDGENAPDAVVASASRIDASGDIVIKLANVLDRPQPVQVDLQGETRLAPNAIVEVIAGAPDDVNTVAEPNKLVSRKTEIPVAGPKFTYELPATSVSVLRLKTR